MTISTESDEDGEYQKDDVPQTSLDPVGDGAYLRVIFDNGTQHYIRNWECPDGLWSEDMFAIQEKPKCVCVKGVYLVSKELCDEEFEILTGNEHCYDISKMKIRKITPLTGQAGLAGRANTVFRRDAPYVARLISPTPTFKVHEPVNYIFRLNDPNDFTAYASMPDGSAVRLGCFEAQTVTLSTTNDSATNPIMQVGQLPECTSEFHGPKEWCKDYLKYMTTIKLGTKWGPKSSGAGSIYGQGFCNSKNKVNTQEVPKVRRGKRKRRAANPVKKSLNSSKIPSLPSESKCTIDKFDPNMIELPTVDLVSPVEYFVDRNDYSDHDKFHTWERHQREVNQQTEIVVRNLMDYHLGNIDSKNDSKTKIADPNKLSAYRYIQISRQIMEKVCPQDKVPSFVLSFMVRVFRIIWLNLTERFLYPEVVIGNSKMNIEILKSLTECRDRAKPISFMKNETCPSQGIYGTNYTEQTFFNGVNLTMPDNVKWTMGSLDMPLETIWKMMLLVHYYCAPNFTNPIYHSQFVVKYEAFLSNPGVLFRWYHSGASNKIMRMILSSYDLTEFAQSIDLCVETANSISPYKGWLKRPADTFMYKRKFDPNMITETTALPYTNSTKSKIATRGGRKKRYYFQNNLWEEQAYCLRNSKGILSEVRSSSVYTCKQPPAWFQNTDNF